MNASVDLLDNVGTAADLSTATSRLSLDSVDHLTSSTPYRVADNLGQVGEGNADEPKSIAPPQARGASETQHWQDQQMQSESNCHTIIYQLDFDVDHVGKNKPASKRMATWKYGIPRSSSLNNDTIIEEHQAQLTWSTHSGRWSVSVDGNDVYASQTKGSVLDYKWKWNHRAGCVVTNDESIHEGEPIVSMRIVACRKPPVRSSKEFRCYEFIIEGRPFRTLPAPKDARDENGSNTSFGSGGGGFENDDNFDDGKLMSILDIVEPGWRSRGFA
ncbi:hypothetical protein HJC23_004359 [Cyclotella cryptica]|uniref:Uncharacterized protein n=1 Tax=Cyclotella cryptica TaxID=29204 RepID=A0ABD3NXV5_9STRA|eukprot:CCRYP_019081-RA/>CCRYP_019081-RA protein AED:0.26 eAED:0.26 QI:0/-1/0/1/-1/1/1/0/272